MCVCVCIFHTRVRFFIGSFVFGFDADVGFLSRFEGEEAKHYDSSNSDGDCRGDAFSWLSIGDVDLGTILNAVHSRFCRDLQESLSSRLKLALFVFDSC